jgi:hypothetical protein
MGWPYMNFAPSTALQRTRVRPAGGRSPLSFETLGDQNVQKGDHDSKRAGGT